MNWRPSTPRKHSLVMLFKAARRRLAGHAGDIAELPCTRIATATMELNHITDDIRDARDAPEELPPATQKERPLRIYTVGKILRPAKDAW
jgi:hypothetical protein